MLTTMWYEAVAAALVFIITGWLLADLWWTSVRSDEAAARHFQKAGTGRKLAIIGWFVILVLVVISLSSCTTPAAARYSAASQPTNAPASATAPANTPAAPANTTVSLKYDETGGTELTPGQTTLIATYLRMTAPIAQSNLEQAVGQIQQEAANAKAEVHEGTTLKLDQRVAWFVWCPNSTEVNPPADVSDILDKLLANETLGKVWIQVPFAEGVPLRNDDTWQGCPGKFWAVALH